MQHELRPQEGLSPIAEFVLSFIQALLKTGYYEPGHPETKKAKKGLYASLKNVLSGHGGISFISVQEKDEKDVLIEGVLDEPTRLSKLMLKGMSEMFIPKFLEYFDRKHLASFSMKSDIAEKEFDNFIDIMSESPMEEDTTGSLREKLTFDLIKNSILSVSTVFNVDLVGKERQLPWRVEIALTRLKNDLSKIPLYKNMSEERLTEIKAMVFDDIIRPVRSSGMIKDLLINLDLIYDTMGTSKEELEDEVSEYFDRDCLLRASPELLKEYLKMQEACRQFKEEDAVHEHFENVRVITQKVARKIARYEKADEELLMRFVTCRLLSEDDLPENKKVRAKRVKTVESFLKSPDEYFKAIEKSPSDELRQRCGIFADILPELLLRSCYEEARKIISVVIKAGFSFSDMGKSFMDELSAGIKARLEGSPKEDQIKIMEVLDLMGEYSIPIYIEVLTNKSRFIRKKACDVLIGHGSDAVPYLVSAVDEKDHWYMTRNLLMILAEIGRGGKEIEDIFKKFVAHEEQRVREQVVKGITNISGINAEGALIDFLKDPASSVRRKAVWGLGIIKSTRPEMVAWLSDVLHGKSDEEEPTLVEALSTIASMTPDIEGAGDIEETIRETLKHKGFMGRLKGKAVLSSKVKVKACEALGAIGTEGSNVILKKLKKDKDLELKNAAAEAIEKIASRK